MKKKSIIAARKFFFLRILCRIYYFWYNEEFSLIKISDIKRKIFRVKFYYKNYAFQRSMSDKRNSFRKRLRY